MESVSLRQRGLSVSKLMRVAGGTARGDMFKAEKATFTRVHIRRPQRGRRNQLPHRPYLLAGRGVEVGALEEQ